MDYQENITDFKDIMHVKWKKNKLKKLKCLQMLERKK
jgi:hypothetical protein